MNELRVRLERPRAGWRALARSFFLGLSVDTRNKATINTIHLVAFVFCNTRIQIQDRSKANRFLSQESISNELLCIVTTG